MVEFVAYVSGEPMACYADRVWQITLLCGIRTGEYSGPAREGSPSASTAKIPC